MIRKMLAATVAALILPALVSAAPTQPTAPAVPPSAPPTGSFRTGANALDYGVKCDGSTDNGASGAFARWVTASAAKGSGFLPPSTSPCMTSIVLNVPSNTTLWAYPNTVTIKATAGSSASPVLFTTAGTSNVTVYGITFDGNIANIGSGNNVLQVYSASNVKFDTVTVQNTRGPGVVLSTNVVNSGFINSAFYNVGMYWQTSTLNADQRQGVAFCCGPSYTTNGTQASTTASIPIANTTGLAVGEDIQSSAYIAPGSYIASLTGTSITLNQPTLSAVPTSTSLNFWTSKGNYLINNRFTLTGLDAASISLQTDFIAQGNYCTTVGGRLTNGGACLYLSGFRRVLIANNVMDSIYGNGIDTVSGSQLTEVGNQVSYAGGAGTNLGSETGVVVSGNVFSNNNQKAAGTTSNLTGGISLAVQNGTGPLKNVILTGNKSYDDQLTQTQNYGLMVYGSTFTITDLFIDASNDFIGNGVAQYGASSTPSPQPAITSCGTSPTLTATSNNTDGQVVEGTVATGCTITFGTAFTNAPQCAVTAEAGLAFSYVVSATAITITNIGALSSTKLDYRCVRK